MKSTLIELFRMIGISVSAFDQKKYDERKLYFSNKAIYEKYKDFTMIPRLSYQDNLDLASLAKTVEGDIVECGVWRGGMIAGIAEILGDNRKYWLFDSFEGLPEAKQIDGEEAINWQKNVTANNYYDNCKAEQEFAQRAMSKTGAKKVELVKGWFSDTVKNSNVKKIAVLRLDGDWYDSTMDCLEAFYPMVADHGIIIIDDYYYWDGCSRAVHDYFSRNSLSDRIRQSPHGVAYIIKNLNLKA